MGLKYCETCGSICSGFYGSGRFCNKSCASKFKKPKKLGRKKLPKLTSEQQKSKKLRLKKPSYAEEYFIRLFKKERLSNYKREHRVDKYFIDFAFIKKKIAVEIDGSHHWKNQEQLKSDECKDKILTDKGWTIFRVKWFNPVNEENKENLYLQINELKKLLRKRKKC